MVAGKTIEELDRSQLYDGDIKGLGLLEKFKANLTDGEKNKNSPPAM